MKLLIGIPAFNEEKMIGKVIKSLPSKIGGIDKTDVLVVDDGSTDETFKIAQNSRAIVLHHLLNRGLGGSLKTIIAYAKDNQYDILVTFDADGQHKTSDIQKLVKSMLEEKYDVVIGSRWLKGSEKIPILRLLVNQFANVLTFLLFGIWTTDSQSGLRAFGKKALKRIQVTSEGMEVSSEFYREIFRNKLKYKEIPVQAVYTDYSKSKGQRLSNALDVSFKLFLKFLK